MTDLDLYEIARFAGLSSEQVPGLKRFMDAYAEQAVERERERCAQPIRARVLLLEREELNWQHAGDYHNETRVRSIISALSGVLLEIERAEHVGGKGE